MHLTQEALYQLTGLCESYRLTRTGGTYFMASHRETFDIFKSVLDIVNQIAEYALNTVTVFFIVFINAYRFGISI